MAPAGARTDTGRSITHDTGRAVRAGITDLQPLLGRLPLPGRLVPLCSRTHSTAASKVVVEWLLRTDACNYVPESHSDFGRAAKSLL